ncbi:unnamed protein product, partial [Laminaria digitata]
ATDQKSCREESSRTPRGNGGDRLRSSQNGVAAARVGASNGDKAHRSNGVSNGGSCRCDCHRVDDGGWIGSNGTGAGHSRGRSSGGSGNGSSNASGSGSSSGGGGDAKNHGSTNRRSQNSPPRCCNCADPAAAPASSGSGSATAPTAAATAAAAAAATALGRRVANGGTLKTLAAGTPRRGRHDRRPEQN